MKLIDSILIAIATAFFVIGVYEIVRSPGNNIAENYWIFMISFLCLFIIGYKKLTRKQKQKD